jgi:hypothetical protein
MSFKIKTLQQVRDRVLTGEPFSITYCTFDEKRGTGGERRTIERAVAPKLRVKTAPAATALKSPSGDLGVSPHHLWNNTFNITDLATNRVKKIHWLLIELYNGYQVVM